MKFKNRDFLTLLDYTPEEIRYMLKIAKQFKKLKKAGKPHHVLTGKNIALVFEKTSTRTRCAFEVAAADLGMHCTYLDPSGSQIGHKESIADTARVLSRMYDGIEYRGFGHEVVEELAEYASVPVWNGLTDEFHPTQMLADALTIEENFGKTKGIKWVFMGDARNNVANSIMVICAKLGMHFVACAPKHLWPKKELIEKCQKIAKETGATLEFEEDPDKAVKNAKVIYTDIWLSMGEPAEKWGSRIHLLKPYQVNSELMSKAAKDAIFLHCLPSFHNLKTEVGRDIKKKFGLDEMEATDEVFESKQSKVFDQAENRMHTIKAIMFLTMYDQKNAK